MSADIWRGSRVLIIEIGDYCAGIKSRALRRQGKHSLAIFESGTRDVGRDTAKPVLLLARRRRYRGAVEIVVVIAQRVVSAVSDGLTGHVQDIVPAHHIGHRTAPS